MSECLSVSCRVSFLLALLALFLVPPGFAQEEGATHAACDAVACIEKPNDCLVTWISLPADQPSVAIHTAEELAAAIPDVVRVKKEFPWGDDVCDNYTWDPLAHTCTPSSSDCQVPEPGAESCGSACFCVRPGEGFEIERTSNRPWQIFGRDGTVDLELPPNHHYIVSVPFGAEGLTAHQLFASFEDCPESGDSSVSSVSKLECNGTLSNYSPSAGINFSLEAGEAYRVLTADCTARAHLKPTGTHVRQGCAGAAYLIEGEGNGSGYGWAVDVIYERPYSALEDAEAKNSFAPGAGPGAAPVDEVLALADDINAQGIFDIVAQVDRSVPDGAGLCVSGRPMNPVLWISAPGIPPGEGCNVNDAGPCDLEGAEISLQPFHAPIVWLDEVFVHWTDTADIYDVVYGRLVELLGSGGDFSLATEGCLVADTRALEESHEWLQPEPEHAFWFLARTLNAWNVGLYDQGAMDGLVASRDPGIQASGADCP